MKKAKLMSALVALAVASPLLAVSLDASACGSCRHHYYRNCGYYPVYTTHVYYRKCCSNRHCCPYRPVCGYGHHGYYRDYYGYDYYPYASYGYDYGYDYGYYYPRYTGAYFFGF